MTKEERLKKKEEVIKLREMDNMCYSDIAYMADVSVKFVESVCLRTKLNIPHPEAKKHSKYSNREIMLTPTQKQLILAGIIGNGQIKYNRTNKVNYLFRATHTLSEKEYCEWKMRSLYPLTDCHTIYPKNFNNDATDSVEFATVSSPTINEYKAMTNAEVITKLNMRGMVIYLLDAGYFSYDTPPMGSFHIPISKKFTLSDRRLLLTKITELGFHCRISLLKNEFIFESQDNDVFYEEAMKFMPKNLDIMGKMFSYKTERGKKKLELTNQFRVLCG